MSEIAIYQPQKQSLSEITFLKDTHLQTKIRNADGYELTKSLAHWITETSFALGIKDHHDWRIRVAANQATDHADHTASRVSGLAVASC
mgnify:CR=1 FL=1